ncbi:hypothetical protein BDR07DRAFT_1325201, partial [Suillus spraguei]
METLYIVWGLTFLVILIALDFALIDDSPPPEPPSLGVCSPSDSPYLHASSQQRTYHQPPPPHLVIQHPQTPSRYSTVQAPSRFQPLPYQPYRPPSTQYHPQATTPLLSRDALAPKPVCYTPQPGPPAARALRAPAVPVVIERPVARAPQIPAVPVVIDPRERPVRSALQVPVVPLVFERPIARAPQVPAAPIEIDPRERPVGSALRVPVVPVAIEHHVTRAPQVPAVPIEIEPRERPVGSVQRVPAVPAVIERPAARAPETPVARVVIDPHEDPKSLRLKAIREGDRMAKCFKERNEAKARNEQQRAKELNQRGEAHRENMMLLDKEASAKIFQENNQNRRNPVDLHGLYVSEAKSYFDIAVQGARDREESSLRVIVGKGNHSDNNAPKIKPAIQAHGKSLGLSIAVDPRNDGCLIYLLVLCCSLRYIPKSVYDGVVIQSIQLV